MNELPARLEPPRHGVTLLLDRSLDMAVREAQAEVAAFEDPDIEAYQPDSDAHRAALERLDAARAKAEGHGTRFEFRHLSRDEKRQLREDHPPTPEQLKEAKKAGRLPPEVNEEEFIPPFLEAACANPDLPEGWFAENIDRGGLTPSEASVLYETALAAQVGAVVVDWGKGSNGTRDSQPNSRTASRARSRTASSKAASAASSPTPTAGS